MYFEHDILYIIYHIMHLIVVSKHFLHEEYEDPYNGVLRDSCPLTLTAETCQNS